MRKLLIVSLLSGIAVTANAPAQSLEDLAKQVLQQPQTQSALADSDIAAGLKQALANGTRAAVNQLGRTDGFWANEHYRIPLPKQLDEAGMLLQAAGYGPQMDQLHLQMNRAAEKAVPLAADVFAEAVSKLTLNDARGILNGPPDAATQYFKRTTSQTLATRFKPIVAGVTSKVGLVQQYNTLLSSAGPAATLLGDSADINSYVTNKALDALFSRVGDEEKSIRSNPAARTTDLLKKVFGGKS
jgi:hypothetical protein